MKFGYRELTDISLERSFYSVGAVIEAKATDIHAR